MEPAAKDAEIPEKPERFWTAADDAQHQYMRTIQAERAAHPGCEKAAAKTATELTKKELARRARRERQRQARTVSIDDPNSQVEPEVPSFVEALADLEAVAECLRRLTPRQRRLIVQALHSHVTFPARRARAKAREIYDRIVGSVPRQ